MFEIIIISTPARKRKQIEHRIPETIDLELEEIVIVEDNHSDAESYYKCDNCDFTAPLYKEITAHVETQHTKVITFACKKCVKTFNL